MSPEIDWIIKIRFLCNHEKNQTRQSEFKKLFP